jgi:O-antigen/teichoic acid export membrane protein
MSEPNKPADRVGERELGSREPVAGGAEPSQGSAVVVGRGVLFIGFAKVYFMLTGTVQRLLLTRLIGPADLGDFAVVNNLLSIPNNTVVQGTIQGVSKPTAEDDARAGAVQRAGVRFGALLGLLIALALIAAAPLVAAKYQTPRLTTFVRIAALIPFLYAVYAVFVGSANGLRRFRTQASFDVGFSTMKTILLLGLAFAWGVRGAFVGFVAAAAIITVVASRVMRLPAPGERFPIRRIAAFMGTVVVYTLLLNYTLNFDVLLLRHFALSAPGVAPTTAAALTGNYDALRTIALLPYQALLVVTFVIFPLVSRATFTEDREATRTYVSQTMRYALILAGAMGIVLAARPSALFDTVYKAEFRVGAAALPILATGECCLALLSVACSILNAAGRALASLTIMGVTAVLMSAGIALAVPRAEPGAPMLVAAATATALATAGGLAAALLVLRTRLGGMPPLVTVGRVGLALLGGVLAARLVPGQGKMVGFVAMALTAVTYVAVLLITREFGPEDRAKFARVLRRR